MGTGDEEFLGGQEYVPPSKQPFSNEPMGVKLIDFGAADKSMVPVVGGQESNLLKSLRHVDGHVGVQVEREVDCVGKGVMEGEKCVCLLQEGEDVERVKPIGLGDVPLVVGPEAEVAIGPFHPHSISGPDGGSSLFIPAHVIAFSSMGTKVREVGLVNRHVRFSLEDSDLSDFSDSIEDLGEDQENKALHKVRRRVKKKALGGGKKPPLVSSNFVNMAECFNGTKEKRKKIYKDRYSSELGGTEVEVGEWEKEVRVVGNGTSEGDKGVVASPPSGLRLILNGEGPHTPLVDACGDPLRKLEAKSLLGIQNGLGFSYTTSTIINTDRLEGMEVVDVKKKVLRESFLVDQ